MRAVLLVAAILGACLRVAAAAPGADAVVYWAAPGQPAGLGDRLRTVATAAGAAFIDRSPEPPEPLVAPRAPAAIGAALSAYTALSFERAIELLDEAAAELERSGGAGLGRAALVELFLFRGLTRIQLGDASAAWDDLVAAARLDPTRVLDPARFPPRAIEQLIRAQRAVHGEPRGTLQVAMPAGCALVVDGGPVARGALEVGFGDHWIRVACAGRAAWGRRVVVDRDRVAVTADVAAVTPPGLDALLIQGRAVGAGPIVTVVVDRGFAHLRVTTADGRERDRATVASDGPGAVDAAGAALAHLLAPPPARRWYRSRWLWAAAGVVAAAAIVIPLAASRDRSTGAVVVRPTGLPW